MKTIKRNIHFLKLLNETSPIQRKPLLKTASSRQIHCLCEICYNILAGNLSVNPKRLKLYKSPIRHIADKKVGLTKKRKILINQTGGFLPLILPAVISAVGGIIGKAIGNHI